jgi:GNAT superfamily N-acetyltransferase
VDTDEQIQLEVADVAFAVNDHKPCIIVVCCSPISSELEVPYPTIIQTDGYSAPALEATVELLFGEHTEVHEDLTLTQAASRPQVWKVEEWDEAQDLNDVQYLWGECVSRRYSLDKQALSQLLNRPGYAKHYVVRDADNEHAIGFCATFFHYVDREGEKLVASVACILVHPRQRSRGIGLSLHSYAITQLKRTRGVIRLQLGSTYPRILYGPPFDMTINEEWFRRRGWQISSNPVYDLVLNCEEWPKSADLQIDNEIKFRPCSQAEMDEVLVLVEKAAAQQDRTGWFDQYWSLMDSPDVKDVLIGVDDNRIVGAALTYLPTSGNQIASNLPWAGRLGNDVGGVTCLCVYRKSGKFLSFA